MLITLLQVFSFKEYFYSQKGAGCLDLLLYNGKVVAVPRLSISMA
jgi:hypothetical protein